MKQILTLAVLCLSALAARAQDSAPSSAVQDPPLRRELLQRTTVDQEGRGAAVKLLLKHGIQDADFGKLPADAKAEFDKINATGQKVDHDNTRWLGELIDRQGWPTKKLVGSDGAHAAWLLVQHADADRAFQRKCLDLVAKLPPNEVSASDVAYLTDRVLVAEGKPQRYGTQFRAVDGKLQPHPIENEGNVDQRRAAAGLPPLAEYLKQAEQFYFGNSK